MPTMINNALRFRARISRRSTLSLLSAAFSCAVLSVAGCSNGAPAVSLSDLTQMTVVTLSDQLIGPPYEPTRSAPTDPPLLKKGEKESVIVAADISGFASLSKGAIPEKALTNARKSVVNDLNKLLTKQGFSATESTAFPPEKPTDNKTLVATLTPVLESAGSPQEKATGRDRQLVLIRLSITDPFNGETLRQRDYYSGKDVLRPNANPNR